MAAREVVIMAEKVTLSVIKKAREVMDSGVKSKTISDFHISRAGDDMELIMTHNHGEEAKEVHQLAWNAFVAASDEAKRLKLYAAGQDLLSDAFSGNVRGQGPGAAEVEFEERKAESVLVFMADKTGPSAYSLPLCRIFMDPFTTTGLVIDARAHQGYDFEIVDVVDHKKVVMSSPAEMYDILTLLGDTTRYAVKRVIHKE